jgi:ABC-2 type transport system permease protein
MSWRRIRLLIWKEFIEISRDRAMLPILIILPIIQLLLFGYVVGSSVKNINLEVLDQDHTVQSRLVTEAFTSSGYFRVAARPTSEKAMENDIDGNSAGAALIIPKGFGQLVGQRRPSQLSIIVDGSDSQTGQLASAYGAQIVQSVSSEFYGAGPIAPGSTPAVGINARTRVLFNPTLRAVNTMVPALLAFIVLMSATNLMSQAIVKERERGTLEQLFVTPIGRTDYLVGKIAPYFLLGTMQVMVVFIVGVLWFQVPFSGSFLVIGVGLLLFMLCSLGVGMLLSLLSRTRQQAQQTSVFLQMPQMMLSGFMFPLAALPTWLYALTFVIPLRYIIVIVRSNFLKGSSFNSLWPQFTALAALSLVIFVFALSRFQKRLAD